MTVLDLGERLERNYRKYHHPEWISPDPLEKVHLYPYPADREVAGLFSALYAYGRVKQILATLTKILVPFGDHPAEFLKKTPPDELPVGVCHRFTSCEQSFGLMRGVGCMLRQYGSLGEAFTKGHTACRREELIAMIEDFSVRLSESSGLGGGFTLPKPSGGSACKRWYLYLRWMVRNDTIDLGCWEGRISPGALLVPLDTHMNRFGHTLGLTTRASADFKTAAELTDSLSRYCGEDPVRYDFSLTRAAYHSGGEL